MSKAVFSESMSKLEHASGEIASNRHNCLSQSLFSKSMIYACSTAYTTQAKIICETMKKSILQVVTGN